MPLFPETPLKNDPVRQSDIAEKSFFKKTLHFFRSCFCLIGIMFFCVAVLKFHFLFQSDSPVVYEPDTILRLNLSQELYESKPSDLIGSVTFGNQPSVADLVEGLHRAAKDPNITALIAYMTDKRISLAHVQELREAVKVFRSAGKRTYFYAPTFGELGGGMALYYLASAFDEILIQPSGEVGLAGMAIETPYFKKALLKLGIAPSFQARYEYKSGADSLNEEKMSEAEKRNLTRILDNLLEMIAQDAGTDRGIDPAEMKNILKNGPYFAEQALELKLIDRIEYADVLENDLKKKDGKMPDIVDLSEYAQTTVPEIKSSDPVIAYIPAVGIIQSGESVFGGDAYHSILGTSSFSALLRDAADDKNVKAIVVRLDSPGGGYTPSDTIRRELEYVGKTSKKPIVCSMGETAASGGYFISLGCDKVLADPATLTGSIGVFGGKLVFKELLNKLEINISSLKMGKNAGMLSATEDFTAEQSQIFNDSLDRIYRDFTAKVAGRRDFSEKQIDSVARGRVFTGEQAAENGLIDRTGGVRSAFETAAEMAKLSEPFHIVELPAQPSRIEMLIGLLDSDTAVYLKKSVLNRGILPSVKAWADRLVGGDFRLFYNGWGSF